MSEAIAFDTLATRSDIAAVKSDLSSVRADLARWMLTGWVAQTGLLAMLFWYFLGFVEIG